MLLLLYVESYRRTEQHSPLALEPEIAVEAV